jgi:Cro/C1-type HTH DNA-binding domain
VTFYTPVEATDEGLCAGISELIRHEMAQQDMSVVALAAASGIPLTTMEARLRNARHLTVSELFSIAAALRVRVDELVP